MCKRFYFKRKSKFIISILYIFQLLILLISVWQWMRLSYQVCLAVNSRYDNVLYCHTERFFDCWNLGMTMDAFVIPKFNTSMTYPSFVILNTSQPPFKFSVWHTLILSYRNFKSVWHMHQLSYWPVHLHCHTYIHTVTYTRTYSIVFQVFSSKTCWLLDFKHLFACWLLFNQVLSCYSAHFFAKIEPSSTEPLSSTELPVSDRVWSI